MKAPSKKLGHPVLCPSCLTSCHTHTHVVQESRLLCLLLRLSNNQDNRTHNKSINSVMASMAERLEGFSSPAGAILVLSFLSEFLSGRDHGWSVRFFFFFFFFYVYYMRPSYVENSPSAGRQSERRKK